MYPLRVCTCEPHPPNLVNVTRISFRLEHSQLFLAKIYQFTIYTIQSVSLFTKSWRNLGPPFTPIWIQLHCRHLDATIYRELNAHQSLTANLLFALNIASYLYSRKRRIPQTIVNPPSRLTPAAIPRFINRGRENRIAPAAIALRTISLAANKDAEYFG